MHLRHPVAPDEFLIFIGHSLRTSPILRGAFADEDLQRHPVHLRHPVAPDECSPRVTYITRGRRLKGTPLSIVAKHSP